MQKTTILEVMPQLETGQLEETVRFYTHNLGFERGNYSYEDGWAHVSRDGFYIMFTHHNELRNFKAPVMSGSIYFRVDHVDPIWHELKDACDIYYPIENFDYGMREFAVYDNNGYILQFGQDISGH